MTSLADMAVEEDHQSMSKWKLLSKSLMELNEKNYAQLSNFVIKELQCLLQVQSELSNSISVSVLYILYERALRELVTSSFPVSANILDALSNSSQDVFEIIQKFMRMHYQELEDKLNDNLNLNCNDVGVVYLLLSVYRLDKVSGRSSSLVSIIEKITKRISSYITTCRDFSDIDLLVMLIFSLIHYSLLNLHKNEETKMLIDFVRTALIKHAESISNFSKVLAVDILEQFQDRNNYVELYSAIYKKIFQPEIFIIPGLSKFIYDIPYPINSMKNADKVDETISDFNDTPISQPSSPASVNGTVDFNGVSGKELYGQSLLEENEKDDLKENLDEDVKENFSSNYGLCGEKETLLSNGGLCGEKETLLSNGGLCGEKETLLSNGGLCDEKENLLSNDGQCGEKENLLLNGGPCGKWSESVAQQEHIQIDSDGREQNPPEQRPVGNKPPPLKWSFSQIQQEDISEKKTEIITVPAKCIGRLIGFEGAITRKLEIESNAVIEVCPLNNEVQRPATSCLTAHKLVTGCLGIPVQLPPEQVEEEKFKLSEAKIKRQLEGKSDKVQSIKISGSQNEIKHASKLINDILTCVVTIHIPLDFTVDEILDKYSGNLKTIEMLLNVFLEVEEQEDEKVVLNISGDEQSCQDAKKLIFDELGSFRSQHGHLFTVPEDMLKVLKNEDGLSKVVETVQQITHARILYLLGPQGYAIFISGFPYQVGRSLQIFQKTNSELICCLSDTMCNKASEIDQINTQMICNFIEESFAGRKRKDGFHPSLVRRESAIKEVNKRLIYSKESLLKLSFTKLSKQFPKNISDDPVVRKIVLDERHSTEAVNRLMSH